MKKSKDLATFAKNYRPLRFKFMHVTVSERMPRQTIFDWPHLTHLRIKSLFGLPINYFDMRPSLTPEGKKRADMAFLTHVIRERDRGVENASRGEIVRYHYIKLRYWLELSHINKNIGHKKADNYMLRWGYLLDFNPSFIELIHGTDVGTALYAIESLQ